MTQYCLAFRFSEREVSKIKTPSKTMPGTRNDFLPPFATLISTAEVLSSLVGLQPKNW
jgi:hypothetical protein